MGFFNDFLKSLFGKKKLEESLEDYYNNKYPKVELSRRRTGKYGSYNIDLRNFIQDKDLLLPTFEGTDDEKAYKALKWMLDNITYVGDSKNYKQTEYWAYGYQTIKRKTGDCEDGAILLNNILLKSGVPYWKLRLTAGNVKLGNKKVGHAYLVYYCEDVARWVVLDWCYWPDLLDIKERLDYKDENKYLDVWFSWNKKYCYSNGLSRKAKEILNDK